VLSIGLGIALLIGVPHLIAPPALNGAPVPEGPGEEEIGVPAAIGEGPLVRVVRLLRVGGTVYAQDPYSDQVVAELDAQEAHDAGRASYAVQRYGYSAGAHKTISLTFDDGPDPVYTTKILDLLSRHHVPATFFDIGREMVRYPDIVRREVREGFAVGNHTLTHVDLFAGTGLRERLEIALADHIFRAQTGRYASYFRLPYESSDEKDDQEHVVAIMRAQQAGYTVASHDFDTFDWAYDDGIRSGPIPMPPLGEQDNITLLLHDGGGDRSRTVEFLERLIPAALAQGYTFQTMPQVQPWMQSQIGVAEVTVWDRIAERFAYVVLVLPADILYLLFILALVTMLGVGVLNTSLALVRARWGRRGTTAETPPVSVVIAAYNEDRVIRRTLDHLLASAYPVAEIIVVDDGSTDDTADLVRRTGETDRRVRLVQQPNGGKWSALNRGFAAARSEHVVTLDGDTLFTPDTIRQLMARFSSPHTGAVAGVIKVGNFRRNLITRWQALEYITQIGLDRSAAAVLDAVMITPGACAAWRKEAVLQAGGYSDATLAEDCDITLMLHQLGWKVEQADEAVAYTEAPETLDDLLKQRVRWMYGTLQAVWRHRNMLLRPRYGWLGMLVMPIAATTILVPLVFTPFIVCSLFQLLVQQGALQVLLCFGAFAVIYGGMALVSVILQRERKVPLLMVPLYRFIYEPLRVYLLYTSLGTALRGVRLGWNKLERTAHMDDGALQHLRARA